MAPRIQKETNKNHSWKWIKKEELKVKRLKKEVKNARSETRKVLADLEELHLTIIHIRKTIRPLLSPDFLSAQLAAILLAGNDDD